MAQAIDKWKLGIALAARQWTKTDLALALGVPRSTFSGWLHGSYPPPADWVDRIERALGVKPFGLRPRSTVAPWPQDADPRLAAVVSAAPLERSRLTGSGELVQAGSEAPANASGHAAACTCGAEAVRG